MKYWPLCVALLAMACGDDGGAPVDAGDVVRDGPLALADASGGATLDASANDASANAPDGMPATFQLTLSPGLGGSVDVNAGSTDLGNCAGGETCMHTIQSGATVILAPVAGTLQHCTWSGDCAGFPKGSSCIRLMDQSYSVGATFDASDADCL